MQLQINGLSPGSHYYYENTTNSVAADTMTAGETYVLI